MTKRIVHLGLGNFARAHLLEYTQQAGGWCVTGVSLRSPSVRNGLAAQNNQYQLAVHEQAPCPITVIDEVLVAPEDPMAVIDALAEADLISLTVTEKGYHLDGQDRLDLTDPVIASDLAGQGPQTAIALLALGLVRRRRPVTVLSCDNRVSNGRVLEQAVADYLAALGQVLPVEVAFPNAMVDRITPATSDPLRDATGDAMAVPTEPFREWVIEDCFVSARPDWPDVQFVTDVAPHELRKLRMLNGAHSFLAYAGTLAGFDYVHEAIADPVLRSQTEALMIEAAATLPAEVQGQAPEYAKALIARFENPGLKHALRQIAMDGTQKLPYRIVAPLRWYIERGQSAPRLSAALEAWVAFCRAEILADRLLDDPKAKQISKARDAQELLALIDAPKTLFA